MIIVKKNINEFIYISINTNTTNNNNIILLFSKYEGKIAQKKFECPH